ncbi:MAG TPA: maleylpyruvate isomerase family mycothiol-dependent enzyme [Trebonia sp.]|jgi:maleylpyruvate isomerase|nr:maleylpyruvate isomerase family mycothiol-dependent enzyme [Trebonia sp.]
MSSEQERPQAALEWMTDGTARLLTAMSKLGDAELGAPTLLPGWNRRHLLSHVANNASALRNLVYWARTGERRRMYESEEQRAADIERDSALPAGELRARVATTAVDLEVDLDGLPAPAWSARIVTAQGLTRFASEIPWMRAREVCIHAIDLGTGVAFADLPPEFLAALTGDVTARRSSAGNCPAVTATATDTGATWTVTGAGDPARVAAPLATLAQWLSGRPVTGLADAAGQPVPPLPPWL